MAEAVSQIYAEQSAHYLALKRGEKNWAVTDVFLRSMCLLSGSNYRVTKSSKPVKTHRSQRGSLRSTLISDELVSEIRLPSNQHRFYLGFLGK